MKIKQIKSLQRYENLITYVLLIAKIVDLQESRSLYVYQGVGVMCKELDDSYHFIRGSSNKFKHSLDLVGECNTH